MFENKIADKLVKSWRTVAPTLLALAGLAATATPAAAANGSVSFAWVSNEAVATGMANAYMPDTRYKTSGFGFVHRNNVGQYTLSMCMNPTNAYEIQVVAYGNDNARCKLVAHPVPWARTYEPFACVNLQNQITWGLRADVSCTNALGQPVNSKFAVQSIGGGGANGVGGYLETSNKGTSLAKQWTVNTAASPYYAAAAANNHWSSSGQAPLLQKMATGSYRVVLTGLPVNSLGVAQVSAVGNDSAHCKLSYTPASSGGPSGVDMRIRCYIQNTLVDSDFMVNWDPQVTRQSVAHMGASLYAHQSTAASYAPQRSFNSGNITNGAPGVNMAGRNAMGQYYTTHTKMAPLYSAVWSGAVGLDSKYCKPMLWRDWNGGVGTNTNCFDSSGNFSDTPYILTYMGPQQGPE